jgi:hypothetical protein
MSKEIEDSISKFMKISSANQSITEFAYLKMRIGDKGIEGR